MLVLELLLLVSCSLAKMTLMHAAIATATGNAPMLGIDINGSETQKVRDDIMTEATLGGFQGCRAFFMPSGQPSSMPSAAYMGMGQVAASRNLSDLE
jgi:hypothetical protein